jgi:hypothetical protein
VTELHNCPKAERSTGQFGQIVERDISAVAELPGINLIGARFISRPATMTDFGQSLEFIPANRAESCVALFRGQR